jgi:hypothetical protein
MTRYKRLILALVASGMALPSASAWADNFEISFTNTIGNVPGTVTLEVMGLTNNTTGPASSVTITSYPSALNPYIADAGTNVLAWEYQNSNVFTETAGNLVSESFGASDIAGGQVEAVVLNTTTNNLGNGPAPIDFLGYGPLTSSINPYIAAVETVPTSPVPVPAAAWLMLSGLGGLAAMARKRSALDRTVS